MSEFPDGEVIVQSREKLVWVLVAAIVMLAMSEWTAFHPESTRYSRELLITAGVGGTVLFGAVAISTIMQLAFPAQLVLSRSGLVYRGPYWRREWKWSEVGEFVIERRQGWRAIRFTAPLGGGLRKFGWGDDREAIPARWQLNIVEVRDALNGARERWG